MCEKDIQEQYPLYRAVCNGMIETVVRLLSEDINAQLLRTALQAAARGGHKVPQAGTDDTNNSDLYVWIGR